MSRRKPRTPNEPHYLNPAARQQRALLARLLRQLDLPDEPALDAFRAAQRSVRAAVRERWSRRGA